MEKTLDTIYKEELIKGSIKKLPFIETVSNLNDVILPQDSILLVNPKIESLRRVNIIMNAKTKEKLLQIYQRGCDIKSYGRIKGNMSYVEDSWDVQIQPLSFKYAYLKDNNLKYTPLNEMKIRDKYIKIKVRYDGSKYVIVNAVKTYFTISHA